LRGDATPFLPWRRPFSRRNGPLQEEPRRRSSCSAPPRLRTGFGRGVTVSRIARSPPPSFRHVWRGMAQRRFGDMHENDRASGSLSPDCSGIDGRSPFTHFLPLRTVALVSRVARVVADYGHGCVVGSQLVLQVPASSGLYSVPALTQ
jgi:hypothetical protein